MLVWTSIGIRFPRCRRKVRIGPPLTAWCKIIIGYWFLLLILQKKRPKELHMSGSTWWKMSVSLPNKWFWRILYIMMWFLQYKSSFYNMFQPEIQGWYLVHAQTERSRSHSIQEVPPYLWWTIFQQFQFKMKLAKSILCHLLIWSLPVTNLQGIWCLIS